MNGTIESYKFFEATQCSERQIEGLFCQTCEILSTCLLLNNVWHTVIVKTCDAVAGEFCNVNDGGCSSAAGPCNPIGHENNFVCNTEGLFPDPYDCQMYHLCFKPTSSPNFLAINMRCPGSSAFSAKTNECTARLGDEICTQQQFLCTYAGEQNPWPGNANIFYVCVASTSIAGERVLFPLLFRCPPFEQHNGDRCVYVEDTTTEDPNETTTPSSIPPPIIFCTESGMFPDPVNCRSFFTCDYNLVLEHWTCQTGSYFDAASRSCVRGTC